jgi:hypothetical protein
MSTSLQITLAAEKHLADLEVMLDSKGRVLSKTLLKQNQHKQNQE